MYYEGVLKFLFFLLISCLVHLLVLFGMDRVSILTRLNPANYSKKSAMSSIKARLVVQQKVKRVSKLGNRRANEPAKGTKGKSRVNDHSKKTKESGDDSILSKYLSDIRELILDNKFKSPIASRLNLKGTSILSFKVKYPNRLKEVIIIKSSGKKLLDESAIETIRRIKEVPAIPTKLGLEEITMTLEMVFE